MWERYRQCDCIKMKLSFMLGALEEPSMYFSIDTIIKEDDIVRYQVERLNSLQPSRLT